MNKYILYIMIFCLGQFVTPILHSETINGEAIYQENCKRCHADDGTGLKADRTLMPALRLVFRKMGDMPESEKLIRVNLIDPETTKKSDEELLKTLKNGTQIDGKDIMPAYEKKFEEKKDQGKLDGSVKEVLDSLIKYIRKLQQN